MRYLFPLFLLVPIIEIYTLLKASDFIGSGWTILAVIGTAVLGAALVKSQGLSTMNSVQTKMAQGQMPAMEVAEGMAILLAGALLLTPGFVTDAIGFICLAPPLRRLIISRVVNKGMINVQTASGFGAHTQGAQSYTNTQTNRQPHRQASDIGNNDSSPIEGEYRDLDN